jgi:3-hydroxyacyl-CoA dehydrogenase
MTDHSGPVELERRGRTLLIWMANPPVNALGHGLRLAVMTALEQGVADDSVAAIALLARGQTFPAGADITEFGKPPRAPILPDLCNAIADCAKPVVAGLHGTTLGGGLELALAAQGRVALDGTRLGLPEVTLGLLPGAGGTQRLPAITGAQVALGMMLSGKPVSAAKALQIGLVDQVVPDGLADATVALAEALAADRRKPSQGEGFKDSKAYLAAIRAAREQVAQQSLPAPKRIVDCVEAALLLPLAQGLAFERASFIDLVSTPQAAALRYAFAAERRIAKMPGARARVRPVKNITFVGAGQDAAPLLMRVLATGAEVFLVDAQKSRLADGLEAVAKALEAAEDRQEISEAEKQRRWAALTPKLDGDADVPADLWILSSAPEGRAPDQPLLLLPTDVPVMALGGPAAGGAMQLGISLLPDSTAPVLAEILVGRSTSPEAIATGLAFLRRLEIRAVQSAGQGISKPMLAAFQAAIRHLSRTEGTQSVEDLFRRWGWEPTSGASLDAFGGSAPKVLGAMANAGLELLGQGLALRPSDIDVVLMKAQGFPRWAGGPMFWAGQRGLLVLRDDLRTWAEDAPDLYTPAPLLDDLIRDGLSLADMDSVD